MRNYLAPLALTAAILWGVGHTAPAQDTVNGIPNQSVVLGSGKFAYNVVPAGTIDGQNTVFTLPDPPKPGTVALYQRGLRERLGVDLTASGNAITMAAAPLTGDSLVADYRF